MAGRVCVSVCVCACVYVGDESARGTAPARLPGLNSSVQRTTAEDGCCSKVSFSALSLLMNVYFNGYLTEGECA